MNLVFLVLLLIILLSFLVIISGVEYAYLASNKLTIEIKKKQGTKSGRLMGRFFDRPETFWNGTVISFYIILVGFCYLFCQLMDWVYSYLGLAPVLQYHFYIQMVVDFLLITLVLLVSIGLLAKRNFEFYPEGKLNTWSLFIAFINNLTRPISSFFVSLSKFILTYLFNVKINKKEAIFTRTNSTQFMRQTVLGHQDTDETNKELFDKALQLTKMKVRRCMTPRNETVAFNIKNSIDDLKQLFADTKLSKIVVYEQHVDNVLGYVHHVDLYRLPKTVKEVLHSIPMIPETMNAIDLMQIFTRDQKSIAWVVDEFGGTAGFVSIENILEEIFGDINEDSEERFTEKQIARDEYIFSGRLELAYLNDKYKFRFPLSDAETLSGYIIAFNESIPEQKEKIIIRNFEFDILRVSTTRVETVKLKILPS